ncbi:MAG TPA: TAXI family TRAP transporter solute-binding subunit [Methylomirabilota bacterium]|nr:TAXI family TRAP transporter solute-binding subunit [Methylomirabilota bacterium]
MPESRWSRTSSWPWSPRWRDPAAGNQARQHQPCRSGPRLGHQVHDYDRQWSRLSITHRCASLDEGKQEVREEQRKSDDEKHNCAPCSPALTRCWPGRELGIRTVAKVRGTRINIGNPGSRQRANIDRVVAILGLRRSDFVDVRELPAAEQHRAFCVKELDVIVYSVGHPNA